MKKNSWWNLLRAIGFLIVFVIVFNFVQMHFGVSDPRSYEAEVGYLKEKPGSLDAVYIGGSAVFEFYQSLFGWSEYGIAVWTYANYSAPVLAMKHYLIEAHKTQPNALFIINMNAFRGWSATTNSAWIHHSVDYLPASLNKYQMIKNLTDHMDTEATLEEKLQYYLPIIRFHSRWNELQPWVFDAAETDYKSSRYSDKLLKQVTDLSKSYIKSDQRLDPPADVQAAFTDLLDYCDEQKLNVLFVTCPQSTTKKAVEHMNSLTDMAVARGYPCLDLLNNVELLGLDMKMEFYNETHTNIHGSLKFSHYLGKYLIDHYGFEDKRGTSGWEDWDKAAEEYNNKIAFYALDFEMDHAERADLDAPKLIRSTAKDQTISIYWELVDGAEGYVIYRKGGGKPWELIKTVKPTTTQYNNINREASVKYTYTVVPYRTVNGEKQYGRFNVQGISKTAGGKAK